MPTEAEVHALCDLTLLKPTATLADFAALANEAVAAGTAAICVPSSRVAHVVPLVSGTDVSVACTVGFPHGNANTAAKAAETAQAVQDGATEIDMVVDIAALIQGDLDAVRADIAAVVAAADGNLVKVILETAMLDETQKRAGAQAVVDAGAHFAKTSTGFGPGGATVEDVALLREVVGQDLGVKASGGIRDLETAIAMIEAGASRIGTSKLPKPKADGAPGGGY